MDPYQANFKLKAIAANIRGKREHRNYTQEYLALRLGISQNAYSKMELGYTKISVERMFQIAEVLEYDVIVLLTIKPEVVYTSGSVNVNVDPLPNSLSAQILPP